MKTGSVDALVEEIVKRRPNLTRERVQELARERTEKIPNISEYTAVLLVAVDLGVKLSLDVPAFTEIRRLVEGLNNVKVRGRVLFVKDEKEFTRKDGTKGTYVRALIGDESGSCDVVFWNWPRKRLDDLGFIENSVVEIVQARTRLSLTGEVELHVNPSAEIREVLEMDEELPSLDSFLRPLSEVEQKESKAHVRGQVVSSPMVREFDREERGPGVVARYRFADGETSGNLVLWDDAVEEYDWIEPGARVAVFNGKPRTGLAGETEIHVGKMTHILPLGGRAGGGGFEVESLRMLKEGYNMSKLYVRVNSVGLPRTSEKTGSHSISLHVLDSSGDATLTFIGEEVSDLESLTRGTVISLSGLRMRSRRDELFLFCDDSTDLNIEPSVPPEADLPDVSAEAMSLDQVSVFNKVVDVEGQVVREPVEEEMRSDIADVRGEFYIEENGKPARVSYLGELTKFTRGQVEVGDRIRIEGSLVDGPSMRADVPYVPLRLRAFSKIVSAS